MCRHYMMWGWPINLFANWVGAINNTPNWLLAVPVFPWMYTQLSLVYFHTGFLSRFVHDGHPTKMMSSGSVSHMTDENIFVLIFD